MASPLRIQSDWAQALRKDEGEAWLSCHPPGKPTLYGSLTCQGIGLDGIPEVTASEGFIVNEINKKSIHISCPEENASSKFLAPYTTFSRIHSKSITCLDISSGGGLGVSSSADGSMKIWQASNGELRRVLEGHVFDVNCCRFFPSGLVVLSGGMDAQLKIWSAEDASCVVTFKGHKGGILDTAIVDRGRNVVSGSRDGTARLWDCGRSACLGVIADCGSSINGMAVGAADNSINLGSPEQMPSVPLCWLRCLQLLHFSLWLLVIGWDTRWKHLSAGREESEVFRFELSDCSYYSWNHIKRVPVQVIHRSGAPVLSLLSFRDGFIASQGDGSCFIVQQDLDYLIELTGADCDPVYKVATWEKQIYTCCRDGLVRRYQLSDL
ncbi:proteasomal ATPase-associated factor 1 isoform X2 [Leopardus geoffroyi]|uniref:proteasomal ATPase-associated factor 1 isoform X2 n=1 Tax=Leopardus geoffroyi TaxID=46844 RepID=UPI001E25FABA|nr:proteasomal ATPase-associated factor 1 isoform X2 [Leopardus geoffroyi]